MEQFLQRILSNDDDSYLPSCKQRQPPAREQPHSFPHLPPSLLSTWPPANLISGLHNSTLMVLVEFKKYLGAIVMDVRI